MQAIDLCLPFSLCKYHWKYTIVNLTHSLIARHNVLLTVAMAHRQCYYFIISKVSSYAMLIEYVNNLTLYSIYPWWSFVIKWLVTAASFQLLHAYRN